MHKSNNKRSESKFNSKVLKQLRLIQSSSITKSLKFFGSALGVQKFLLGTTVAAVAWAGCVSCHKSYVNSNFVKQPMLTCLTEEGDADIDKLKKNKKLKNKTVKKRHTSQKTSKPKGSKAGKKGPKLRLKRLEAQGLASEGKLKKARKKPHNLSRALNPIKRRVCLPSKAARTRSKSKACIQPSLETVRFKKRKQKEELKKFKIENGKQLEKALHKLNLSNKKALMKLQQALTKKLKSKTVKKRHTSQKTSKPKGSKASKKGSKLRLNRLEAQGLASEGKLKKARKKPHNPSRALNPIKRRVCLSSKAARTRSKSKACVQPSLERVRFKKGKSVNPKLIQRWLKLLKLPFFAKLAEEYLNKNLEKKSNKNNISNTVEAEKVYEIAQNDSDLKDLKLEAKEVEQLKDAFKTHKSKKLKIKEFEYFFKKTDCDVEQLDCYCRKLGTSEEQKVAYGCSDKSNMVEFKNMLWIKLSKTVLGVSLEPNGGPGKGRILLDMGCIGSDFFKEEELAGNEIGAKEKAKEKAKVVKEEAEEGVKGESEEEAKILELDDDDIKLLSCLVKILSAQYSKAEHKKGELSIFSFDAGDYSGDMPTCYDSNQEEKSNDCNCNSKINNETNNNALMCQENRKTPGKPKGQEELAGNEIGAKEKAKEKAKRLELADDEIKKTESHPDKICSAPYLKADQKNIELSISSFDAGDYAGDYAGDMLTCDDSKQEEEFNDCNYNFKINNETNNNALMCQENCKNPGKLKGQEELAGNEIGAKEKAKVAKEVKGEVKEEAKILELADDEIKQTESHSDKICSPSYLKVEHKKGKLPIFSFDAGDYSGEKSTCYDSYQEEESNDHNCNSKINNETNNNALICQENCKNPGKPKGQEELAENEIEAKKEEAKEVKEVKEEVKEEVEEEVEKGANSKESNDYNCNSKISNETNNNALMCQENRKNPGKPKGQEEFAGNEIEAKILELDDDDIKLLSCLVKILSAQYSKAEHKEGKQYIFSSAGDYSGDMLTCDDSKQEEEFNDCNCNFKINNETNNNAFICQENLRLFRV